MNQYLRWSPGFKRRHETVNKSIHDKSKVSNCDSPQHQQQDEDNVITLIDDDDEEEEEEEEGSATKVRKTESSTSTSTDASKANAFSRLMSNFRHQHDESTQGGIKEDIVAPEMASAASEPPAHWVKESSTQDDEKRNGLTMLMKKAREKPFTMHFHVWLEESPLSNTEAPPRLGGAFRKWRWILAMADEPELPELRVHWRGEANATFLSGTTSPAASRVVTTTSLPSGQHDSNNVIKELVKRTRSNGLNFSSSQLKSIMQKAVRRKRPSTAVKAAALLLHRDETDLLRRLPIVVLEDSFLHPVFPVLVWMMIAVSKGYMLSSLHYYLILTTVAEIANTDWLDTPHLPQLPPDASPEHQKQLQEKTLSFSNVKLDTNQHPELGNESSVLEQRLDIQHVLQSLVTVDRGSLGTWVVCILLRSSFGGMKGDMSMCADFARLWMARFQCQYMFFGNDRKRIPDTLETHRHRTMLTFGCLYRCDIFEDGTHCYNWLLAMYKANKLELQSAANVDAEAPVAEYIADLNLQEKEIPVAAIDFHCSNILDALKNSSKEDVKAKMYTAYNVAQDRGLLEDCPEFDSLLKRTIWTFSAGTNLRKWVPAYDWNDKQDLQNVAEIWRENESEHRRELLPIWRKIVHPLNAIAKEIIRKKLCS